MLHLIICIDLQRERQTSAMASISYRAPPGSVFIATQDLAGLDGKCFSYTALKAAKTAMSLKKQVILMTFSGLLPAAARTAVTFLHVLPGP